MKKRLSIFLFFLLCLFPSCTKDREENMDYVGDNIVPHQTVYSRIAFLGGSQCLHGFRGTSTYTYDSFPLKDKLLERLGIKEENLEVVAMEGAGAARPEFSNPAAMNLCRQAKELAGRAPCDIYVIWLQTNDYTGSGNMPYPVEIGNYEDAPSDGDIANDRETFFGALNYTIATLRSINPKAKILLLSPTRCILQFYSLGEDERGYIASEYTGERENLYHYVKAMQDYAQYHSLPFLNLFTNTGISIGNKKGEAAKNIWLMYHLDGTHLNPLGYDKLSDKIVNFIEEEGAKADNSRPSAENFIGHFYDLPVIVLTTQDGQDIMSRSLYQENVQVEFYDAQGQMTMSAPAKVRGGGNTGWGKFPKKSYEIKFDSKQSLLDEHNGREWVLVANYSDKTSLRNDLALWMGRELSNLDYTSSSHFVGLILNGKFLGLYQLMEQVKLASHRVDVGNDGFLMEFDARATSEDITFNVSYWPVPIVIKEWTVAEGLSNEDYLYCSKYVQDAESALFGADFANEDEGYAKYMDVSSFVDWMLINEIAKNNDAILYTSCYMNLSRGGKLKMGPLWNFDIGFGNVNYNDNDLPDGLWIGERCRWFKRMLLDKRFARLTRERFMHFYENKASILEHIDAQYQMLKNPLSVNESIWQTLGMYVWPNPVWFDTCDEEVAYLKNWLIGRLEWLKAYYEELE